MFESIIAFSLRRRMLVLLGTLVLMVGGIFAFSRLPIDAVPDVTNNQVQILTSAAALSPLEIEQFVTFPIELALKTLPDVDEMRSISKSGLSVVTVVFDDDVDIYFARQLVLEKLREAEEEMPEGAERPELAPVSTGLGEIFRYVVRDTTGRLSPMDLRTIQDWIVRRHLLGVPGLAEVNSLGGYVKQYHVLVDPARLVAYGLTLEDVFRAAAEASGTAGGAYVERGPEQFSVRSVGLVQNLDDLRRTVIKTTPTGTPVLLSDVASVETGAAIRFGAASQDGRGEVVTGITMQLKDANARVVVNAVKERIETIRASLPEGVVIEPYYDREALVNRTIGTVAENLGFGALLVVVVLLVFLAHLRAGLILASVIPLSMCFAAILMVLTGQTGNLMSLGAIDFGLVVDGSLIIVENVLRLVARRQTDGAPLSDDEGMRQLVFSGAVEMIRSAKFGVLIIIIVYLPIMTLGGIEGKMFRPMALTVSYALIGALLLSVTFVPVMCSYLLRGERPIKESLVIRWIHRYYRPLLERALELRGTIVGAAVVCFVLSILAFSRLGGEFIPRLDEGDVALHIIRLPSVSLTESNRITAEVERRLKAFPEVVTVVTSTGRAEISTDPMGVELADAYVILKPRDEWPEKRTKAELVDAMAEAVEDVPGAGVQFLQPIEMRTNELIAGVRGDVAIKLFGEDFEVLDRIAGQVETILRDTPGAADVTLEQTTGQPYLVVRPDRDALGRYGVTVDEINETVSVAIGGRTAGQVYEGEKRFDVVVRYGAEARRDAESIRNLLIDTPAGGRIPLSALAGIAREEGPAQVSRENGSRFMTVQANVRGRDVGSFVEEIRSRIGRNVKLPPGYTVVYGGQFENLQEASRRLMVVVPLSLLLIFLLLAQAFRSLRLGVMIFLCVPMAVIGAVFALVAAGMPFSISAGVGFIALFGIAVLNGIVMVAAFRKFEQQGLPVEHAVVAGAEERLRPVVTTATLAGLGFLPMLVAQGAGAEVQRPLATVIIGGLATATLLTLFVLPILYVWFSRRSTDIAVDRENANSADSSTETGWSRWMRGRGRPGGILTAIWLMGMATALPAFAQAPREYTLEVVRARALETAPEVRSGQASILEAQASRSAAGWLPPTEVFYETDNVPAGGSPDERELSMGIEQRFELPTAYGSRRRMLSKVVDRAEAELDVIRSDVAYRVTRLFIDVVAAGRKLVLADTAVAVSRQFVSASTRRRELGEATALEALQASVALAAAERSRVEAEGQVVANSTELRTLLALPPDFLPLDDGVLESVASMPEGITLAELESQMANRNPEVRLAQNLVDVVRANRSIVAAGRLPAVSVRLARQTIGGVGGYYGGGLRLEVPLFRLFNRAADHEARAAVAVAETRAETAVLDGLIELRRVYAEWDAARRQVTSFTARMLPTARQAYAIALQLRASGEAGYVEVLSAQTAYIETQSAYIDALQTAARLAAQIESLTGPYSL